MCSHLKPLEEYLITQGANEIYRGQVWSKNCREWIYFDVVLDPKSLKERFHFDETITIHNYKDIKVGSELGLVCDICKDAIMGIHPDTPASKNKQIIH